MQCGCVAHFHLARLCGSLCGSFRLTSAAASSNSFVRAARAGVPAAAFEFGGGTNGSHDPIIGAEPPGVALAAHDSVARAAGIAVMTLRQWEWGGGG